MPETIIQLAMDIRAAETLLRGLAQLPYGEVAGLYRGLEAEIARQIAQGGPTAAQAAGTEDDTPETESALVGPPVEPQAGGAGGLSWD